MSGRMKFQQIDNETKIEMTVIGIRRTNNLYSRRRCSYIAREIRTVFIRTVRFTITLYVTANILRPCGHSSVDWLEFWVCFFIWKVHSSSYAGPTEQWRIGVKVILGRSVWHLLDKWNRCMEDIVMNCLSHSGWWCDDAMMTYQTSSYSDAEKNGGSLKQNKLSSKWYTLLWSCPIARIQLVFC